MQDSNNTKKRSQAGRTVLFFAILFVLFMVASHVIRVACTDNDKLVQDRNKSLYRLDNEKEQTLDVVILGDSLSYSAFSPMEWWDQYGAAGFVCGQPGQKIPETYQLLKTVYEKQSPKLVILETNVLFRASEGKVQDVIEKVEAWANNYIAIYRGHDIWKTAVTEKDYSEENYKGFGFRTKVVPYKNKAYMKRTDKVKRMSDTVIEHLGLIQELCEEHGSELLLVSAPSPKNYDFRKHNGISDYADANNIPYLDLNLDVAKMELNWKKDTLDGGDHLNLRGALKASNYLGEYLHENYELPDRRGDAAHAEWQPLYDHYADRVVEELVDMKRYDR